ncbi:unnamed protein product, partial [Brassica oleracea var. botrytis]
IVHSLCSRSLWLCTLKLMNTSPIEKLVLEVSATPAEVTQQLMASKDADIAFKGLLEFLETKKIKKEEDTKWRKQRLPYLKYRGSVQPPYGPFQILFFFNFLLTYIILRL